MSSNIVLGKTYSHNTKINLEEFYIQWNTICHKIEFIYVVLLSFYIVYGFFKLCYLSTIKDKIRKVPLKCDFIICEERKTALHYFYHYLKL